MFLPSLCSNITNNTCNMQKFFPLVVLNKPQHTCCHRNCNNFFLPIKIFLVDPISLQFFHFIPLKTTHKATNVVDIFMREIAQLHGVPKTIVSDRDPKFTSKLWKGLFKGFGTNLNFSTSYHPKSDGQT